MKTTVIYHNADFDGIFCREIAKKFLGTEGLNYVGWNFGDPPLSVPDGELYVLDLPLDRPFGFYNANDWPHLISTVERKVKLVWIDHHKTSIDTHPKDIPGYRIDGVAACRLAWQWFAFDCPTNAYELPQKQAFIDRKVSEPLSVRLAGEYDIWDVKRMAEDSGILRFQYGLKAYDSPPFTKLLESGSEIYVDQILESGRSAQTYAENMDALWLAESGHIIEWEGLKFLAKNTVERGSNMFRSKDVIETGHDALLAYGFRGNLWTVSLYHASHRKDIDLSEIAKKHGGGGHKGACGFTCKQLPFILA